MNQAYEINRGPFVAAKINPTVESNLEVQGKWRPVVVDYTTPIYEWRSRLARAVVNRAANCKTAHGHGNSLQVGPLADRPPPFPPLDKGYSLMQAQLHKPSALPALVSFAKGPSGGRWDVARERRAGGGRIYFPVHPPPPLSPPGLPRTNDSKQATEQGKHAMPATEASDRAGHARPAGGSGRWRGRQPQPWTPMGTEAAAHGHLPCWFRAPRGGRAARGPPSVRGRERDGFHRGMCRRGPTAERWHVVSTDDNDCARRSLMTAWQVATGHDAHAHS